MNILWYISVCSCFFAAAYTSHKRQENKKLRSRLRAAEEPIDRQFINMAA